MDDLIMTADPNEPNSTPWLDLEAADPFAPPQIELEEIPATRIRTPVSPSPALMESAVIPIILTEDEPVRPSHFKALKVFFSKGYFDPFKAFGHRVDWKKFRKAQTFLLLLSLVTPFLTLIFTGFLLSFLYLIGASLNSVTPPNAFHELALYPLVFILTKGYWLAYLALSLGAFALGWVWAGFTAWNISRDQSDYLIDFKKALSILAMVGVMAAPLTMFPFLRLVALVILLWNTTKRMHETFSISWSTFLLRGGVAFLAITFAYSWFERKVESAFPAGTELNANIEAYMRHGKKLEWPASHEKIVRPAYESVLADLNSFDATVREEATRKALAIVKSGQEAPAVRFQLAKRVADLGQPDAMVLTSRAFREGRGTPANLASAIEWMHKAVQANPKQLDIRLEEAELLMLNKRTLDGKRLFVGIAKDNMSNTENYCLSKIAEFIQGKGFGKSDSGLHSQIQDLYQTAYSPVSNYYDNYYDGNSRYRRYDTGNSTRDNLLRKLNSDSRGNEYWFYRALVAERGQDGPAEPSVYGEETVAISESALAQRIESGDPVAMEIAGDKSYRDGDVDRARELWLKAALLLNSDNRMANAPFYLKLSESYDPTTAKKKPDSRMATKYYLASLLVSSGQREESPTLIRALHRLGVATVPDSQSQAFIDMCLKHDIAEAWAVMGGRYLNGDSAGVPRNATRARDCFLKAQSLGYRGPLVFKFLIDLDPENATKWKSLAQAK